MPRPTFFVVEFTTPEGPQISQTFSQLKNARKLAKLLSAKWPSRIMAGGQGGMEVA